MREIPILLIAPLGLAAAVMSHALLQAIANFGLGASRFASHAHSAVEPVLFVEIALALWLSGVALRDTLTIRQPPYYKAAPLRRLGIGRLTFWAGLIAVIAITTLFGMEYSESGSAAFGLGWLGGVLIPGAIALTIAITTAIGALFLALAGHLAGFAHLLALFAAALARYVATLLAPALPQQRIPARPLAARRVPVARHAGLRAPPTTTR